MLSKHQLDFAVSSNRGAKLDKFQWQVVQRLVSTKPDGVPGPKTARAIAVYQHAHGFSVDGIATPAILCMSGLHVQPPSGLPSRGAWLDMAPGEVLGPRRLPRYIARLRELGISSASLMLTSSKRTERPVFKWSLDEYDELASGFAAENFPLGLTVWPRPWSEFSLDLAEQVEEYVSLHRPHRIEFDAEGNWTRGDVRGFDDLEDAADSVVSLFREMYDGELVCTTIPEHFENSAQAQLSRRCDVLIPQAYSLYRPGKEKYQWGERYSPGVMQRWSLARAKDVPGVKVECGLAAWAQKFPGKSIARAMTEAASEVKAQGCEHSHYWSLKHVMRQWRSANARRDWLRANPAGAR